MAIEPLVLLTLSIGAALEAWAKGSIFNSIRAYLEEPPHRFNEFCRGFGRELVSLFTPSTAKLAELMHCRFCLSYHLPWISLLIFSLFEDLGIPWYKIPLYSLSITFVLTRLLNLSHKLENRDDAIRTN